MKKQNLAIMYNGEAGEVPCAICGGETDAQVGFELCLANSKQLELGLKASRQIVCQYCAEQHAPVLAEQFGHLIFLKHNKALQGKVVPWAYRELETIGILGTILKLSEREDVAYVGRIIADTVVELRKELKTLASCPEPRAAVDDDVPF